MHLLETMVVPVDSICIDASSDTMHSETTGHPATGAAQKCDERLPVAED